MAKLSTKQRNKLPKSDFAEPGDRKYPVEDKSHAKNALARVSQHGSPAEKKAVAAKVHKKFPGITIKGRKGESKSSGKYSRSKGQHKRMSRKK